MLYPKIYEHEKMQESAESCRSLARLLKHKKKAQDVIAVWRRSMTRWRFVEVCVIWSLEDAKSHKVSMPRRRFHLSWACEIHVSWILWLNGSKVKSVIDQELKGLTSSSSSSRRVTTRVTICNRIREETSLSSIGVSESSGGERELESVREREIVSERELVREGVSLCI